MNKIMKCRKFTDADIPIIAGLYLDLETSQNDFCGFLKLKDSLNAVDFVVEKIKTGRVYYLVEVEEEIVGMVAYTIKNYPQNTPSSRAIINNLYIKPEHRNKGFARALVDKMLAEIMENGVKEVILNVYTENEIAQNFWNEMGFKDSSVKKIIKLED